MRITGGSVALWPKVTIIWLNYNTSHIMWLALRSLQSIFEMDYPNLELVVVDNGSSDGSWRVVKKFIERKNPSNVKIKTVELSRNYGFTGGNNAGFRVRDSGSRYVVLLNNDAIALPDSLRTMVEYMEGDESLGGLQGVVLNLATKKIDSAGLFVSELLSTHSCFMGRSAKEVKKEYYVSYATGAYSIYRVRALVKAGMVDKLFDHGMFAYYDDNVLGLKLWNTGFRVIVIPYVVALHRGSATFGRFSLYKHYYGLRSWATLNEISNSKYKKLIRLFLQFIALRAEMYSILKGGKIKFKRSPLVGVLEGIKIGRRKRSAGEHIDIYKAPILTVPIKLVFLFVLYRRLLKRLLNKYLDKHLSHYVYKKDLIKR